MPEQDDDNLTRERDIRAVPPPPHQTRHTVDDPQDDPRLRKLKKAKQGGQSVQEEGPESATVRVDSEMKQPGVAAKRIPAKLKPEVTVKVGVWLREGRANQKEFFNINAVGAKPADIKLLSRQPQFEKAVKSVLNQSAVAVPVLAGQRRLNPSLSPQEEQRLKSAINLAIAGGASTIQIPRDSQFTPAERSCMADHIAELNAAAKQAHVPTKAIAQLNLTASQQIDIALQEIQKAREDRDTQQSTRQAKEQPQERVTEGGQQIFQDDQVQQQNMQFQNSVSSVLPEDLKQALIEYDPDDMGANPDIVFDDLSSVVDQGALQSVATTAVTGVSM